MHWRSRERARRFVPALPFAPSGLVERQAGVVGETHAAAVRQIFVEGRTPFARDVDLGGGWAREAERGERYEKCTHTSGRVTHTGRDGSAIPE